MGRVLPPLPNHSVFQNMPLRPGPHFTLHPRHPSSTSPDILPVPILPCWAPVTHSGVQDPFIHSAVSCIPIRASGQHREKLSSLKEAKHLWVPSLRNSKPGAIVLLTGGPGPPGAQSLPEGDL